MEINQAPPASQDPVSDFSQQQVSGQPLASTTFDGLASTEAIFRGLSSYPFENDEEYQLGLAAIVGHPEILATSEEIQQNQDLVLQAKCFYFMRKFNTLQIDPAAYQSWLLSRGTSAATLNDMPQTSKAGVADVEQISVASATATSEEQPPYPNSFAHIVDLITQNKPIPGIEEVPDTVLEPGSSKQDHTPRRRKPWEAQGSESSRGAGAGVEESTNSNILRTEEIAPAVREMYQTSESKHDGDDGIQHRQTTGQGVVRILQPDGIADTGLIAKE